MRPAGSYRGARRNEAKKHRKAMKRRSVGEAMLSYTQILHVNSLRQRRQQQEGIES